MRRAGTVLAAAAALGLACGKPSSGPAAGSATPPATASSPSASGPLPAPSASAKGPTAAPATAGRTLSGTYHTVAATLSEPPGWNKGRAGGDPTAGVGDGHVQLAVEPVTGRVTGTLDGAIGSALLEGMVDGAKISASVRRNDPADRGFTGTLSAVLGDGKASGVLALTSADGSAIRAGTVDLAQATSP